MKNPTTYLEKTGEREIPTIPGTLEGIENKHLERYLWASVFTQNKKVYDIACGVGYGSLILKASRYFGFDNSKKTIDYANKYYSKPKLVNFFLADACNMKSKIGMSDVIISFETIEHIKDPEAFLRWSSKHAKICLISSPIRGSYKASRYHLFELRLKIFQKVLKKYFSSVTMFIQKDNGIIFPCLSEDKGTAIAVCQN